MERAYPPFHGSEVAAAKQALENAIEIVGRWALPAVPKTILSDIQAAAGAVVPMLYP
jgi:hypothetical protein